MWKGMHCPLFKKKQILFGSQLKSSLAYAEGPCKEPGVELFKELFHPPVIAYNYCQCSVPSANLVQLHPIPK